jgi:hypothetical protein
MSKLDENAIDSIKMNKWRKNSQTTVKKLVTKFSIPWFQKISRPELNFLKEVKTRFPSK